jgi:hypothetical protein
MTARKARPNRGEPVRPGDSSRDIAAKLGMSRRQQWQARKIAEIPADEFDAMVESDNPPTVAELLDVAQHRAGSAKVQRRCPHCGGVLA